MKNEDLFTASKQNYTLSQLNGIIDYSVLIQEKIGNILGSLSWYSLGLLYAQELDKNSQILYLYSLFYLSPFQGFVIHIFSNMYSRYLMAQ
jgi:hypothetical protein